MRKHIKNCRKGFTLVELIVVLVILAVLAAMLVPALTGYIKRARSEKDLQFAATLRVAAQSLLTEMYGKGELPNIDHRGYVGNSQNTTSYTWSRAFRSEIEELAGLESGTMAKDNPYMLIIQCGRYPKYAGTADEGYAYTVFRIYFQSTKDSDIYILDDNGVYKSTDTSYTVTRDYVIVNGEKIYTIVYGVNNGGYSAPKDAMDRIEKHLI